jgi:hypothetical protein
MSLFSKHFNGVVGAVKKIGVCFTFSSPLLVSAAVVEAGGGAVRAAGAVAGVGGMGAEVLVAGGGAANVAAAVGAFFATPVGLIVGGVLIGGVVVGGVGYGIYALVHQNPKGQQGVQVHQHLQELTIRDAQGEVVPLTQELLDNLINNRVNQTLFDNLLREVEELKEKERLAQEKAIKNDEAIAQIPLLNQEVHNSHAMIINLLRRVEQLTEENLNLTEELIAERKRSSDLGEQLLAERAITSQQKNELIETRSLLDATTNERNSFKEQTEKYALRIKELEHQLKLKSDHQSEAALQNLEDEACLTEKTIQDPLLLSSPTQSLSHSGFSFGSIESLSLKQSAQLPSLGASPFSSNGVDSVEDYYVVSGKKGLKKRSN